MNTLQKVGMWLRKISPAVSKRDVCVWKGQVLYGANLFVLSRRFSRSTNRKVYDKIIIIIRRSQHSRECHSPCRKRFLFCDLDLWPFNPEIYEFPGLTVDPVHVKFGITLHRFFGCLVEQMPQNTLPTCLLSARVIIPVSMFMVLLPLWEFICLM